MAESPMLDDRWSSIWTVFHEVVEQPAEKRAPLLAEACGDDSELRREVEELLAVHDEGVPILDESIFDLAPTLPPSGDADSGPSLRPGALLAGRFEIVDGIAAGGMGEVYRAYDRELGREVALKTLVAGRRGSASALARFRREIHLAQQVTHRNVCRVFDLVRDGNLLFLTMELLEGETLGERLEHEGRLALAEIRSILNQIVAALEAAHAVGVVHRDLKPSNVILVEDSSGLRVVVTDFGLATSGSLGPDDDPQITRTGELMGTPAYMAPEQLEGNEVNPATDVYAIGLLLYEMVTGKRPYIGRSAFFVASRRLEGPPPSPKEHAPELDERWEQVILRCLERRPEDRFQHPRETVEALEDESISRPARRENIRGRWRLWAAALFAVISVVITGLLWKAWIPFFSQHEATAEVVPLGFEKQDAVIVAEFDNLTGDRSLDGAVAPALALQLSTSTFVTVASPARIDDALRLMRKPADTVIGMEIARQVALRDGRIRAVVAGTAEKIGASIIVTANLIAPVDGSVLATWSEQVPEGNAGVPAALAKIALGIRKNLGENAGVVEASAKQLERVTTPSLRALRLYDEADTAISRMRSDIAEELLVEAVREDPGFASAHILLAWATHNLRRNPEEYLPHAERAMELAPGVPDRERYFIRASYFGFRGDDGRQITNLQALLRLHPDHFWANSNMAALMIMRGSHLMAVPYYMRLAESHPNDFRANSSAARSLAIIANRPEDARAFVDRSVELAPTAEIVPWNESRHANIAWARLWTAHEYWRRGHLEAALDELERWAAELDTLGGSEGYWMRQHLIRGFRTLGMETRGFEVAPLPEYRLTRQYFIGTDAFFNGDREAVKRAFAGGAWKERDWLEEISFDPLRVAGLARSGWIEEAGAAVEQFGRRHQGLAIRNVMAARMRGELELADKRVEESVHLLESGAFDDSNEPMYTDSAAYFEMYGASFFLAAQALATAYLELERHEDALSVLQRAVAERARSYPNGSELWMDTQLRLARLHRELGNVGEANRLEEELRDLMRLADPDFWLVRRLNEISPDS